jgi:hypothetical protein
LEIIHEGTDEVGHRLLNNFLSNPGLRTGACMALLQLIAQYTLSIAKGF